MKYLDRYLKSKRVGHIGYDNWKPEKNSKYLRYIPKDVKTVLDIGCGLGELLWILKKEGYNVEGCDFDKVCIERAKKVIREVNFADVQKLSKYYPTDSFDLITCIHVLEHLPHAYEALIEIRKVTKKYVLLAVPNTRYITVDGRETHLFSWNKNSLNSFIESAGFKIISLSEDWTNFIPNILRLTPVLSKILLRAFYDPFELIALARKE